MRELAPIPTKENVIALLTAARDEGRMFEYRMSKNSRKHLAVDLYSVSMLLLLLEKVNEKNRDRLLSMAPNVGKMALIALSAINRSDVMKGRMK